MRLDKFIAGGAQLSRSEARLAITKGKVMVNGAVCKKNEQNVTEQDQIELNGTSLVREEYVYIMLNKPKGVVSATTDGRDTTVVDLLGGAYPRRQLFPAGRLDKASTGFVLLTDDGQFAHEILSPKRHVAKTYYVTIDVPVTSEMVTAFEAGVTLADGKRMKPAGLIPDLQNPFCATVVLRQGVYHQIKRMFGQLGAGVNELHRLAIGGLCLDEGLAMGEWRPLTAAEKLAVQQ